MKIGIYAKSVRNAKHEESFRTLVAKLSQEGHEIYTTTGLTDYIHIHYGSNYDLQTFDYCNADHKLFDLMICVGGDGTILDTVGLIRDSDIPVLGLNTGRMGFLAPLDFEFLNTALFNIEKGNFLIESRSLLQIESSEILFDYNIGLNDFVIHKKETSSMIVVHTYLNGEFLNSYWADGLIVSTPTGSTGYSLSCGGPIIFPRSNNFIITPIAPHNLNVRPVVVNDDYVISFEIEGRAVSYMASIDSRSRSISSDTQIAVKKAPHNLNLIRFPEDGFMDTLRNKLSWGADTRN